MPHHLPDQRTETGAVWSMKERATARAVGRRRHHAAHRPRRLLGPNTRPE
jgi:hypothetical protein